MARTRRDDGDLTAPSTRPLGANDSLAGARTAATPSRPSRGFVRCVNDTTGGVADLPESALNAYRERGWRPITEAARGPQNPVRVHTEPDTGGDALIPRAVDPADEADANTPTPQED